MTPPPHVETIPAFGWTVETTYEPAPDGTPEHEKIVQGRSLHILEIGTLPLAGPNGAPITFALRELVMPFGRDPAGRAVWEKIAHALVTGKEPAPDIDVAKTLHGLLGLGPDGKPRRG